VARQIGTLQEWLNLDQAAEYLGVSKRSVITAINLCKNKVCNENLRIKRFGNRTLISKSSIDDTPNIITKSGGVV
tara:strand:- start:476 stop:700 length:225 start_codon:yes stop_codon:yes gene_type:complete